MLYILHSQWRERNTTPTGSQVNLTRLSEDLWKTVSNWSQLISDPNENRSKDGAQLAFVKMPKFVLVANRKLLNINE